MKLVKHIGRLVLLYVALFAPASFVYAQDGVTLAKQFVVKINQVIVYPLILLMLAVALVIFMYGAFEYVMHADNEGERETGRKHLLWGVVGILVMVSAYAILEIAANTFGLSGELQSSRSR